MADSSTLSNTTIGPGGVPQATLIPTPAAAAATGPAGSTYSVAKGDTLSAIALKNNTSVAALAALNGIANPNLISIGQTIKLPGATATTPVSTTAVQKPGSTAAPIGTTAATVVPGATTSANPGNASTVTTPDAAHAFINNGQTNDYNTATTSTSDAPPVKTPVGTGTTPDSTDTSGDTSGTTPAPISPSAALTAAEATVNAATLPNGTPPTAPDYVAQFNNYRTQYGVTDLENSLTDLQNQAAAIQAQNETNQAAENFKPGVAQNVIDGRQSEEQSQAQVKLDSLNLAITSTTQALNTKYNVINQLMTLTKQNYDAASSAYQTAYSNNIAVFNAAKGITADQNTADEQAKDDARSNLQIIYNAISTGGTDPSTLTPAQQTNITKLETQAGLPVGFYDNIIQKNPGGTIVSTTTRDANGTKYADVLTKDAQGNLSVNTVSLGASDTGTGTQADKTAQGFADINSLLTKKNAQGVPYTVNSQGKYFTAAGFQSLVSAAAEDNISRSDFIKQYGDKLDPSDYAGYGLTGAEIQGLNGSNQAVVLTTTQPGK